MGCLEVLPASDLQPVTLSSSLSDTIEKLGYAGDGLIAEGQDLQDVQDARRESWVEIRSKTAVDAAYFRGAIPLVAFASVKNAAAAQGLHQRLWNLSRLPLLIIELPDQTAALSCIVPPEDVSPLGTNACLEIVPTEGSAAALDEFSRFHMEAGQVARNWPDRFRPRDRVDQQLLGNLRALRSQLGGELDHATAVDTLIGRSIFLRYMEDRSILTAVHLETMTSHASVVDVLRGGASAAYELFSGLSDRFNGDVFSYDYVEQAIITDSDVEAIADFLSGTDLITGQLSFWPYDFAVIPTELISSIYEQLLDGTQRADSAYYTPRPVVELILDEVMPSEGALAQPTVLDPACGSGIFLAEAFRRMVRQRKGASFEELSEVLVSSVFGVDRNPKAIAVASLSLYLTLLEHVDPPTAWDRARLPSLVGRNLIVSDFFSADEVFDRRFDIVIGNPPWRGSLSEPASRYVREHELQIPDQQIAWAFVFAAIHLLSDDGRLGLLLPAKSFLHNKRRGELVARQGLFGLLEVSTVMDLSCLRRSIFSSATAPAAIVIGQNVTGRVPGDGDQDPVLHIVPKNSPLQTALDGYLISQNDIHEIPYPIASSVPEIWKLLLWGDMDDFFLVKRLRERFATLGRKIESSGWLCSRGFQSGGPSKMDATAMQGRDVIPANAIDAYRIDRSKLTKMSTPILHRTRPLGLYAAPKVLIRRGLINQQRIAATLSDDDAVFNDSVIGISGQPSDRDDLAVVTAFVNSSFAQYFHFLTGSAWGVERDTIDKNEHLSIPLPTLLPHQKAKVVGLVSQILDDPGQELELRTELDEIFFAALGLSDREVALVRDRVSFGIEHFRKGSDSRSFAAPERHQTLTYLKLVENTVIDLLPGVSIRSELSEPTPFYLTASFAISIPGSDPPGVPILVGDVAAEMIDHKGAAWAGSSTVLQPSLIVVDDNSVHLIKPLEARYWTSTSAYSDAAEVVASLAQAPSQRLASH